MAIELYTFIGAVFATVITSIGTVLYVTLHLDNRMHEMHKETKEENLSVIKELRLETKELVEAIKEDVKAMQTAQADFYKQYIKILEDQSRGK